MEGSQNRLGVSPLQMLPLSAADGSQAFPSDQTLRIHALSVPPQDFVAGSFLQLVIGEWPAFFWSVDDAILRSKAMQHADAFVEQVVQQRHKYDGASLLLLERQLRSLQTAHMIQIEPTIVVPPRQGVSLNVWSGPSVERHSGARPQWSLGEWLRDSDLFVRLACSWVRDVG